MIMAIFNHPEILEFQTKMYGNQQSLDDQLSDMRAVIGGIKAISKLTMSRRY